jgi:hypothetical protein
MSEFVGCLLPAVGAKMASGHVATGGRDTMETGLALFEISTRPVAAP